MFKHDVDRIESAVEQHIKNYSDSISQLSTDKKEIISRTSSNMKLTKLIVVVSLIEKLELLALLSRWINPYADIKVRKTAASN